MWSRQRRLELTPHTFDFTHPLRRTRRAEITCMAAASDVATWIEAFTTGAKLIRRWAAEHERTESLFAALLEFHGRLQLLELQGASAAKTALQAAEPPDALSRLHARHVRGLENLLAALHTSAQKFEELQEELSEVHAQIRLQCGGTLADECMPSPAISGSGSSSGTTVDHAIWGLVGAGRGLDAQQVGLPSPRVCAGWVRELDEQFAAELLLKLELLDSIDLASGSNALSGVHRLWVLQPHLNPETLSRTTALAESLTLALGSRSSSSS